MKKRLFILALCLCLLLASLPAAAHADNRLAFVSINDTLPPELVNCFTYYGGAIYVPAWIFASYGFGIYFSYTAETGTATLYNSSGQLSFDLTTGSTYDDMGNQYTLAGIFWGGSVYVPISYVASYFGTFSFNTIGTDYGTVLRIKDGRVVLTDSEFVKAAMTLLKQYYNAYNTDSGKDDVQQPEDTDNGSQHEGSDVIMAFAGLPGEAALEAMEQYDITGCFFLSYEEVLSDPDLVRRLAGSGHSLGVMWDGTDKESFSRTAELIFEAARVKTVLAAAPEEFAESCAEMAGELSLVFYEQDVDATYPAEEGKSPYLITSAIEVFSGDEALSLLINCREGMEETLAIVFNYLRVNKFDLFTPSEIIF